MWLTPKLQNWRRKKSEGFDIRRISFLSKLGQACLTAVHGGDVLIVNKSFPGAW